MVGCSGHVESSAPGPAAVWGSAAAARRRGLLALAAGTRPLPSIKLAFCPDITLPWTFELAGTLLTVIGTALLWHQTLSAAALPVGSAGSPGPYRARATGPAFCLPAPLLLPFLPSSTHILRCGRSRRVG